MKNIAPISIIVIVATFLVFFGISQYGQKKKSENNSYMTQVTKPTGVLILSGDKDKIEPFKKDFEKNDYMNKYWDHLHLSTAYEKEGKLELAILELEEALKVIKNGVEAHGGLSRLYEKTGQYDLAIEEYDWEIACQENARQDSLVKGYKTDAVQREKLIQDLKFSRTRVEELKRREPPSDGRFKLSVQHL